MAKQVILSKKLERVMKVGLEAGERLRRHRKRIIKRSEKAIRIIREFKAEQGEKNE